MSRIDVSQGQNINQGQNIGGVGCTGDATSTHLHYEVRVGSNSTSSCVDPLSYFSDYELEEGADGSEVTSTTSVVTSGTCGVDGDNLIWTLDDAGLLTVSGTGNMYNYSCCGAPWYLLSTSIKSAKIESDVTSIGNHAFYCCTNLTTVEISDTVTSIGEYAFLHCSSLLSINVLDDNHIYSSSDGVLFDKNKATLICCPGGKAGAYSVPNSVTSIGDHAFDHCTRLTGVETGDCVTSIGSAAFYFCTGLISVEIPNSVISIGNHAFWECESLTSLDIPSSVTSIGDDALSYCKELCSINVSDDNDTFSSVDGVLFNKEKTTLLCCPAGKTDSYFVPDTVTSIYHCAFYSCEKLTSIEIPYSVTDIGYLAFLNCNQLQNINVSLDNSNYSSSEGVLFDKLKKTLICCPCSKSGIYSIPASVTSIGYSAFSGNGVTDM